MRTRSSILPLLFAAQAGLGSQALADDTAPTCAIIVEGSSTLNESPILPLLETDLVESGRVRLLERGEIERILREQQIDLLFSPQGADKRSFVGKLLKADLLVVLRLDRSARPKEQIDAVVCETRMGLRLWTCSIPQPGDPQAVAAVLESVICEAAKRVVDPHLKIFAVPPFVSQDITRESDHLQTGFARMVEEIVSRQRSTAVVELAEAEAIAREVSLSGEAVGEGRRLPFFIMGEFRHEGVKDARKIALSVSLTYKGQLLDRLSRSELAPGDAPAALAGMVAKLLTKAEVESTDVNPVDEARILAERAEVFLKIGNWKEARELLEASLLLDSNQPRLHGIAARLWIDGTQPATPANTTDEQVALKITQLQAALDHLEAAIFADNVENLRELLSLLLRRSGLYGGNLQGPLAESCTQLNQRRREIALRFLKYNLAAGRRLTFVLPEDWESVSVGVADGYETRLLALQVSSFTSSSLRCNRNAYNPEMRQAHIRFLERASELPNPEVAAEARRELTAWRTRGADAKYGAHVPASSPAASRPRPLPPRIATQPTEAEADLVFRPISFTCQDASLLDTERPPRAGGVRGWRACGPNLDLAWTGTDVFFMREKGRLDRVIALPSEARLEPEHACWDGKYAWVAETGENARLHVVDGSNNKVSVIRAEDGLPTMQRSLVLPVLPGQVCVLGAFGDQQSTEATRSWCALVSIGRNAVPSVDVLRESRLNDLFERQARPERVRDEPDYAFNPLAGFVLDRSTGGIPDLLVLRSRHYNSVSPFLIHPAERTIELGEASHFGSDAVRSGEYLYWPCRQGKAMGFLHRTHLKTLQCENLGVRVPTTSGQLVSARDNLYWCGREFWRWRNGQDAFERVRVAPSINRSCWTLFESSHYGFVLPAPHGVYQMETRSKR